MVYKDEINFRTKCVVKLKKLYIRLFLFHRPYKFLTYEETTEGNEKRGILNQPETYNWSYIHPIINQIFVYTSLKNKSKFNYYNATFRSNFFKTNKDRFKPDGIFKPNEIKISSLEKGILLGNAGVVYSAEKRAFIKETILHYFLPYKYNIFSHVLKLPVIQKLRGRGILLAHPGAEGGVYHFVLECLPKIKFIDHLIDDIDYFFLPGPTEDWKLKWLAFFKIPLNRVIWIDFFSHIEVEQLIFISPIFIDQRPDTNLRNLFKEQEEVFSKGLIRTVIQRKKIWLTRKGQKTRNILWEEDFLKENTEFISIDFSLLTISESIEICKQADFIVGPHGAAFIHILFCHYQTTIVEIFPNEHIQPVYGRMSNICDLDYHCIKLNFEATYSQELSTEILKFKNID